MYVHGGAMVLFLSPLASKKCSYLQYTLQLFFATNRLFSTVLNMGNDFYNIFFRKIFAVSCVVCKGLV